MQSMFRVPVVMLEAIAVRADDVVWVGPYCAPGWAYGEVIALQVRGDERPTLFPGDELYGDKFVSPPRTLELLRQLSDELVHTLAERWPDNPWSKPTRELLRAESKRRAKP